MTFDPLVYYGILLLSIAVTALTIVVYATFRPRLGAAYAFWALLVGGGAAYLAHRDVFTDFEASPPPFVFAILVFFAGPIALGRTRMGQSAAEAVPLQLLVLMQAFRLPLEIVMHYASGVGIMPEQMSFAGFNYDIITGASALVIGLIMLFKPNFSTRVVLLWNWWGCLCLAVIAYLAIASSPMFMVFGKDPLQVNNWVLHFPYVLLPALLVSNAIFTHVAIFHKLKLLKQDGNKLAP